MYICKISLFTKSVSQMIHIIKYSTFKLPSAKCHKTSWETLFRVKVWCCQATRHYLNQCWPRLMTPYGTSGRNELITNCEQSLDVDPCLLVFFGDTSICFSIWIIKYITVTSKWARWRLKSSAYRLFAQPFDQAQIKENIKAPRYWTLWGKSTGDRWFPLTKGQ